VVGAYCALVSWHILNNERIEMRKNTDLVWALQAFHRIGSHKLLQTFRKFYCFRTEMTTDHRWHQWSGMPCHHLWRTINFLQQHHLSEILMNAYCQW
jgi:hypothetical protein